MAKKKQAKEPVEKEIMICLNHTPSLIFKFRPTKKKPDAICPLCKHDEYLSNYSGDKLPNLKEVKAIESGEQPEPTLVEQKPDTPVEKPKKDKDTQPDIRNWIQ